MAFELLALRFLHIIGGSIWVGWGIVSAIWIFPAMKELGPTAADVTAALMRRGMFRAMPIIALVTLLSGVRLLMIASGGFQASYFQSASGMTFAIAGVLGILSFLIGFFLARPRMLKGKTDAMVAASALLVLSASMMAVARYIQ